MKLIYQNFDGLDMSFQGAISQPILMQLEQAKKEAQQSRSEVYCELGEGKLPVMVSESGMSGGYAYRFDTGIDGEVWAVSNSQKSDGWNIRVSAKSLNLALKGYHGVKEQIINTLKALNATGESSLDPDTGKVINFPKERISRFDYCFDFLTYDSFEPDPKCIVAHARSSRQFIGSHVAARGQLVESARIGEMPNRQVGIYNKSKEMVAHNKRYWIDIWRGYRGAIDKNTIDEAIAYSTIDTPIGIGTVWRIEVRAGKGELDKWNCKRFDEFETIAGDIVVSILGAIKYVTPNEDTNTARWPIVGFWQTAIDAAKTDLSAYISGADRKRIIRDYRENIIKGYMERISGNYIGCIAAMGRDLSELPAIMDQVQENIIAKVSQNPDLYYKKFGRVEERYSFIE